MFKKFFQVIFWNNRFNNSCQPNFRRNVMPDPAKSCGPYKPDLEKKSKINEKRYNKHVSANNHDTIGMIAIDSKGNIAAGILKLYPSVSIYSGKVSLFYDL